VQSIYDSLSQTLRLFSGETAPIILCIGSDRVTGDCFGPLTGERLIKVHNVDAFVYGTLNTPVTALNLLKTLAFIKIKHPHQAVLAIDSALGEKHEVGSIRVIADGIYPGAATGKKLPKAGDFSLTATVAPMGPGELLGVRLGFVSNLASLASEAIANAIKAQNRPQNKPLQYPV